MSSSNSAHPAHIHAPHMTTLRTAGGQGGGTVPAMSAPSVISMSWASATSAAAVAAAAAANIQTLNPVAATSGGGDTITSTPTATAQTIRVIPGSALSHSNTVAAAPPQIATAFVTAGAPSSALTPSVSTAPVTATTVFVSNEASSVAGKPSTIIGQTQLLHPHDGGNNTGLPSSLPTSGHQPLTTVLAPPATQLYPPQAHSQSHTTVLTATPGTVLTLPTSVNTVAAAVKSATSNIRPGVGIIQEASKAISMGQAASALSGAHPTLHITTTSSTHGNQGALSSAQSQQQFQRLKVEDALSYLDQVKFKFNNQPQVYNDFLDIMKEFKSQSIDTPGVIQRVSNLFKGHPELIVGFNTFLPPGYKIEMQANDQVNVSMPSSALIIQTTSGATTLVNTSTHGGTNNPLVNITGPHHPVQLSTVGNQQTLKASFNSSSTLNQSPIHSSIRSGPTAIIEAHQVTPQVATVTNTTTSSTVGNSLTINTTTSSSSTTANNASTTQPVEFNHAINYVNKIKNRFQGQPEVYKQFLEILHAYQKEQKILKEGKQTENKPLTESEVYSQVAKLFQNQEDLLQEFGQFLPDANGPSPSVFAVSNSFSSSAHGTGLAQPSLTAAISGAQNVDSVVAASRGTTNDHGTIIKKPLIKSSTGSSSSSNIGTASATNISGTTTTTTNISNTINPVSGIGGAVNSQMSSNSSLHQNVTIKRNLTTSGLIAQQTQNQPQHNLSSKRPKMTSLRDVTLAEAGKYGSLNEFAFFDKVRKALRVQEVYDNFLRCLVLYNNEIVSKNELILLVTQFLGKFPDLLKWFKDFVGCGEANANNANAVANYSQNSSNVLNNMEGLPQRVVGIRERERDRLNSEVGMEIDYASCKRYGASYRALPKNFQQPKCSGRTSLCKEVLNDTWVSFPSWSEDSTFVTSRKTQYEEYIYRCEDERFELDVVIETNLATIRVLEAVQKKLNRMTIDERNKFRLDDSLGGTSVVIHQRAIRRIYGDKASEIIEGLKKNPAVAVPLVLRRLKAKEEEWREAQKQFNKVWREQNEKYYLKSLDHQGISFKQNDIKYLRSKSLLNEIETIYEQEDANSSTNQSSANNGSNNNPHMTLVYKNKLMIEEACNLIIHHVKRQTSIHKEDKQKIKQLLRQFVPDLFSTPRGDLSDDEVEDMDTNEPTVTNSKNNKEENGKNSTKSTNCKDSMQENKNQQNKNVLTGTTNVTSSNNNNNSISSNTTTTPHIPPLHNLKGCNYLTNNDPDDSYSLFFVNNNWYFFFRLHHILCDRLNKIYEKAKLLAAEEAKERCNRKESTAAALRLKPKNDYDVEEYFPALVDMIKQVLDCNLDSNQYEDQLREMFGIHAYIAFTLDKVVQNIVRQLQHLVCDEICAQCTELFAEESKQHGTGGTCISNSTRFNQEYSYQKKAEHLLADENCFRVIIYKNEGKLTIDLLDTETVETESEEDGSEIDKWSEYIEKYVKEDDTISEELKEKLAKKPVFLPRNIRGWRERQKKTEDEEDKDGIKHSDDTQCKFNVNSYKMVFVVQSESYLCKRMALAKARMNHNKVTTYLYNRFNAWHQKWLNKNASEESLKECEDWLLGRIYDKEKNETINKPLNSANTTSNGNNSNNGVKEEVKLRTAQITIKELNRAPYRPFCKYKVKPIENINSSVTNSPAR